MKKVKFAVSMGLTLIVVVQAGRGFLGLAREIVRARRESREWKEEQYLRGEN